MEKQNEALMTAETLGRKRRAHTIARTVIRVLFFIAMPGAFAAGFAGVKLIFSNIAEGSPLEFGAFTWTLIALSAFTIVFGRFFCGYACAFGSFGDFSYWVSGLAQTKLFKRKKQFSLPEKVSRPLRSIKYLNLAVIVLLIVLSVYPRLKGTSPWDVFSKLTALNFDLGTNAVGIALFALCVALMAAEPRGFCMYLCPLGALFALLPQFGALRRDKQRCAPGCSLCKMSALSYNGSPSKNARPCSSLGKCAATQSIITPILLL